MKRLLTIGVLAVAGMAVGCSSGKDKQTKAPVDYTQPPVAAPVHEPMPVTPVASAPVTNVQPVAYETRTERNQVVEPATRGGGTKYVVKKGDTLWSIATKTYNDGKQYKKICAANPSIKGEKVLVGQTIILP